MTTRTTLTTFALLFLVAGGVALAPVSVAAADAALCGQIRYLPDGTKVTIEVEGDRCVHDVKADTCTCTSAA